MVAQRGVKIPANFHTDRLRSVPPGYLYQVIRNGYGAMGDYGDQIPVNDRWAIVAYVKALQLSRDASLNEVPADHRGQLSAGNQPQPGARDDDRPPPSMFRPNWSAISGVCSRPLSEPGLFWRSSA